MHRRDKRKTAQPTPLSIISRHPAVPPLLRCTRLPAVPSPFGCARYPAAPSLFGPNPVIPLYHPVQKQPAALQYRPVGRHLAALTWALFGHKLVALLYRFCSNILHCPAAASLTDHSLPPAPCLSTAPFPPAVQLHSDAPTASLCRCCSQAAPVVLPYRNRPAVASLFE